MPDSAQATDYFTRSHRLESGVRVRLRLARPGDQRPVALLLDHLGFDPEIVQLRDLVRFDPRQRSVVCATALIGGAERVIGFGAVDRTAAGAPAAVVAEPGFGPELIRLLRGGLRARARLASRT